MSLYSSFTINAVKGNVFFEENVICTIKYFLYVLMMIYILPINRYVVYSIICHIVCICILYVVDMRPLFSNIYLNTQVIKWLWYAKYIHRFKITCIYISSYSQLDTWCTIKDFISRFYFGVAISIQLILRLPPALGGLLGRASLNYFDTSLDHCFGDLAKNQLAMDLWSNRKIGFAKEHLEDL